MGLELLKQEGGASHFIEKKGSFDLAIKEFSKLKYVF
jgi:hypothetical protein